MIISGVEAKKRRLVETFRLAISLLEEIDQVDGEENNRNSKRRTG